jgi:phycocyanin beta chain
VAVSIQKMKEASIAVANDSNGITLGDCSALTAELGSYFDRAAIAIV